MLALHNQLRVVGARRPVERAAAGAAAAAAVVAQLTVALDRNRRAVG